MPAVRLSHVGLLLCALAHLSSAVSAAEAIRITLLPKAVVQHSRLVLADVATITADAGMKARLAAVAVQDMRGPGVYHIDERLVRSVVQAAIGRQAVTITGVCQARRASRTHTIEELAAAAQKAFAKRAGDKDVESRLVRCSGPITVLVDGDEDVLQAEPLSDSVWGQVPYRVKLLRRGKELQRSLVVLEVAAYREVPVAIRRLSRDQVIRAGDLKMKRIKLNLRSGAEPPQIEDLVGRVTNRRIEAGDPIGMRETNPPIIVKAGTPATLLFVHDHFTISVLATALSDGRAGDVIRLRQPNGRVVNGKVKENGEVRVNF